MSWLAIPFRKKRTRLLFFVTCLSHFVCPSFTLDLLSWICFWQFVAFLVLVHFMALTFLIVQLLVLSQNDNMAPIIHMYYHWLGTLVNSQIQRFPHHYHLA